ncbi:MAG: hypothetical protein JWP03_3289 [Phycisphaerales bacterium]|nr:hypothetical protein [Phycisphaerales bacterium]
MTHKKPTFDVFLSSAPGDIGWAKEVVSRFLDAGLSVYDEADARMSENMSDGVWEAIAESYALVVLLGGGSVKPLSLSFLFGVAMGRQKPVFVLYQGEHPPEVPAYVRGFAKPFRAKDVGKLVDHVREISRPLSEHDRQLLIESYAATGVAVDELLSDPEEFDRLSKNFNRAAKSKSHVPEERLLGEILRLRKRGALPRLQKQHV